MIPSGMCAMCFIPICFPPPLPFPCLLFLPSSSPPSFSQSVPTLVFICVFPCVCMYVHTRVFVGVGMGMCTAHSVCLEIRRQLWVVFHLAFHVVWTSLLILLCFSLLHMPDQLAHELPGTLLTLPLIPQEEHCDCRHRLSSRPGTKSCFWVLELRSLCLRIKCLHTESSSQHSNLNFTATCIQLSYFLPPLRSFSPSRGRFYLQIHTHISF